MAGSPSRAAAFAFISPSMLTKPLLRPGVSDCARPHASMNSGWSAWICSLVQPAASHDHDHSPLIGGNAIVPAKAASRGGGQDSARSAANEPAAVASGGHGPSAVHGTGAVESRVDVRGRLSDQHGCARELYTTRADPTGA